MFVPRHSAILILAMMLVPASLPAEDPVQQAAAPSANAGQQQESVGTVVSRTVGILNIGFAHDPGLGNYDGVVGSPHDVWNFVDVGTTAKDFLRTSDARPSTARLRVSQHDGEWGITGQPGIFQGYIYHNCRCVDLEVTLTDLPADRYRAYVFAHGDAPDQNALIELKVGNRTIGKKATAADGTWNFRSKPFAENVHYVTFDFAASPGRPVTFISHRAASAYSMFNAIQLVPLGPVTGNIPTNVPPDDAPASAIPANNPR